jgi:hypothetical protein
MPGYPPGGRGLPCPKKFPPTRSLPWVNHPVAAKVAPLGNESQIRPTASPTSMAGLVSNTESSASVFRRRNMREPMLVDDAGMRRGGVHEEGRSREVVAGRIGGGAARGGDRR